MGGLYIRVDNSGWEEMYASAPYLELLELYLDDKGYPQDLRSNFVTKRYVEDGTNTDIYPITLNVIIRIGRLPIQRNKTILQITNIVRFLLKNRLMERMP